MYSEQKKIIWKYRKLKPTTFVVVIIIILVPQYECKHRHYKCYLGAKME